MNLDPRTTALVLIEQALLSARMPLSLADPFTAFHRIAISAGEPRASTHQDAFRPADTTPLK
jgi:hypothetical protein